MPIWAPGNEQKFLSQKGSGFQCSETSFRLESANSYLNELRRVRYSSVLYCRRKGCSLLTMWKGRRWQKMSPITQLIHHWTAPTAFPISFLHPPFLKHVGQRRRYLTEMSGLYWQKRSNRSLIRNVSFLCKQRKVTKDKKSLVMFQ